MEDEKETTTVSEDFAADAIFLRGLASGDYDCGFTAMLGVKEIVWLNRIADNVEMMSTAMFRPEYQLEKEVERSLSGAALYRKRLEFPDDVKEALLNLDNTIATAAWYLGRKMESSANRNMVGSSIGGLLNAFGGSAIKKAMEDSKKNDLGDTSDE